MVRGIYIMCFSFIFIISSITASVAINPLYADQPAFGETKKTDKAISDNPQDIIIQGVDQQDSRSHTGLKYKVLDKNAAPQKKSFVRLKPKSGNNGILDDQKVYDIEFMDDKIREDKTDASPSDMPRLVIQKVESLDKSNFIRRETVKENKTEVSLGYKISPYSEIYLGKGFLIEQNDIAFFQPHDDGWRFKFKVNF